MVEYFENEYFDGKCKVNVSNIDCLENMTQEMANAIATGPQDDFFELLSSFNREMKLTIDDTIDVTDKWNWRPGTYAKIDKYIQARLQLSKKTSGLYNKFRKVREYANYLGYITNQADRLEAKKYSMKTSGLSKDVNIEVFQENSTKLAEIMIAQCELVKDLTDGKVIITPYINNNFANRFTPIYLDIQMTNLEMSIHQGNTCIQKIPLLPIHIVINYPLRHYMNQYNTNWSVLGNYGDYMDNEYHFPYISTQYQRRGYNQYGTVCLDSYMENVKSSFMKRDYIQMAMHLMNWAQYYNVSHSNPYNQPNLLHYGLPEGYSKEYKATTSNLASNCSERIHRNLVNGTSCVDFNSRPLLDKLTMSTSKCEETKCQLRDACNFYKIKNSLLKGISEHTDEYCQMESIVGHMLSYYDDRPNIYSTRYGIQEDIENQELGYYSVSDCINTEEYLVTLFEKIITYWGLTSDTIDLYYSKISDSYEYYGEAVPVEQVVKSEEDIKQEMLAWATNPERR